MVMLRATADYAGVTTVDTSLYFNISVYNSTREFLLFNIILIPSADDFSGTSVTLSHVVSLSQSDTYLFIATAVNRYGSSLESEQAIITFLDSGERKIITIHAINYSVDVQNFKENFQEMEYLLPQNFNSVKIFVRLSTKIKS